MEILIATLVVTIVSPIIYVLYNLVGNHFKNQYFQKNLSNLPIPDGQKPLIGHLNLLLGDKNYKNLQDSHKSLGKTFGCYLGNVRVISTIDLDFIYEFAINDDHHNRDFNLKIAIEALESDNLATCRGEQWHRIRKAVAPAFSKHKVMSENVQDGISSVIDKFVDSIELRLDKAKKENGINFIIEDIDNRFHRFTLALVFSCFYKREDIIDFNSETNHLWQTVIEKARKLFCSKLTTIPMIFPIVNPFLKLIAKINHPFDKIQILIMSFVKEQAELYKRAISESENKMKGEKNRMIDGAKFTMKDGTIFKANMVDYFISKFLDKSITEREFLHTSFHLFVASDTEIMDASSKLVYLLANNQNIQDKLRESIIIDGTESTYLTWTINESLRLFPPAQIGCSRTLAYDINSKFGTIPKDTLLITPLWTIHRWPEYWGEDADDFKPERWAKSDTFHPMQFMPFGAGRRGCPGKQFALISIRMLMVQLLTRFKFERCEKSVDQLDFLAPFYLIMVSEQPNWIKVCRFENKVLSKTNSNI